MAGTRVCTAHSCSRRGVYRGWERVRWIPGAGCQLSGIWRELAERDRPLISNLTGRVAQTLPRKPIVCHSANPSLTLRALCSSCVRAAFSAPGFFASSLASCSLSLALHPPLPLPLSLSLTELTPLTWEWSTLPSSSEHSVAAQDPHGTTHPHQPNQHTSGCGRVGVAYRSGCNSSFLHCLQQLSSLQLNREQPTQTLPPIGRVLPKQT